MALERLQLDGVTVINKESNTAYYPRYYLDPNRAIRNELTRKDYLELRDYVISLPDKYDIFIDLHDNTSPNSRYTKWLKKELSYDYGKMMPGGVVAINATKQPDHCFASINVHHVLPPAEINCQLEAMKNQSKFPLDLMMDNRHPYYTKPKTKIDAAIEFYFARFKRTQRIEAWQYSVDDGVSIVMDLISCIRSL